MNSIKTGVVVVVLLGVLYGVYKVLNVPEPTLTREEQESLTIADNLTVEGGSEVDPNSFTFGDPPSTTAPSDSDSYAEPDFATELPDVSHEAPSLTHQESGGSGTRIETAVAPEVSHHHAPEARPDVETGAASPDPSRFAPETEGDRQPHTPVATEDPGGSFYVSRAKEATRATPTTDPSTSDSALDADIAARAFQRAMFKAEELIAEGRFRAALEELTKFHDAPGLTNQQRQTLMNWLDPLAGKVIYSSEHLLEEPRVVRSGESLAEIADTCGVPTQLLYNINRSKINNPNVLLPGTELKIVRGPFRAHVSLSSGKLTLFLGELYAGHFPVTAGIDPAPQTGTYYVKQILQGRDYVSRDGQRIPAETDENPYGRWWIDLGSEVAIHGTAASGNNDGRGCISLSAVDIADLAEILSRESQVRIED